MILKRTLNECWFISFQDQQNQLCSLLIRNCTFQLLFSHFKGFVSKIFNSTDCNTSISSLSSLFTMFPFSWDMDDKSDSCLRFLLRKCNATMAKKLFSQIFLKKSKMRRVNVLVIIWFSTVCCLFIERKPSAIGPSKEIVDTWKRRYFEQPADEGQIKSLQLKVPKEELK